MCRRRTTLQQNTIQHQSNILPAFTLLHASPLLSPLCPYWHIASSAVNLGRHFGSLFGSQFFVSLSNYILQKSDVVSALFNYSYKKRG